MNITGYKTQREFADILFQNKPEYVIGFFDDIKRQLDARDPLATQVIEYIVSSLKAAFSINDDELTIPMDERAAKLAKEYGIGFFDAYFAILRQLSGDEIAKL